MLNLTSLCKNLESEVNRLELDARAALHQTKTRSNLAADKLHDDVLELKSEMSKTLTEVREQNTNLASFLSEMTQEVEMMESRTDKMEAFMCLYGYQPKIRIDTVTNIAPAAAGEFEEASEDMEETRGDSKHVAMAEDPSIDSPSIYNIGLSKYALQAILGKSESGGEKEEDIGQGIGSTMAAAASPNKDYFPTEEDLDSSPAVIQRQLHFSMDVSGVDITPDISRKSYRPPDRTHESIELPNTNFQFSMASPEMPELQTISLRKLLGPLDPDTPDLSPQ